MRSGLIVFRPANGLAGAGNPGATGTSLSEGLPHLHLRRALIGFLCEDGNHGHSQLNAHAGYAPDHAAQPDLCGAHQ
jgi:hypothetical protein